MDYIVEEYFKWLCDYVKHGKYRNRNKLLEKLHNINYTYFVDFDRNRLNDGLNMRRYFSEDTGYDDILYWNSKCSVLEMLVGLAVQMQNMTEDNSDRFKACNWFWEMVNNLELSSMTNNKYDETYVEHVIDIFMNRKYKRNGMKYNVFIINNTYDDLTKVELWYQMCWYIDDVYK
ncbi:hypothetical protein [Romboutsia sp.]|uniref:hypothetical protein n=1 Tax=Romboutsia sp. TaxID=1965302 RepID=UPI002C49E009|nr:hypothetical protein [Romboutsia sp.]HSQ89899.1 hypothetical protein [Romboutsia sp.]